VSVGCAGPNRASSTLLAEAYRQEYGAPYGQSGGMLGGPNTSLTAHQAPPQSPDNLHLPTRSERALSAYPFQPTSPSPHQSSYRLSTRSATPSTLASTLCSIPAVQRIISAPGTTLQTPIPSHRHWPRVSSSSNDPAHLRLSRSRFSSPVWGRDGAGTSTGGHSLAVRTLGWG
jgi:hypothetical protein